MAMTLAEFKRYQHSVAVAEKNKMRTQVFLLRAAQHDDKNFKKFLDQLDGR